jgi:hypothetical protein
VTHVLRECREVLQHEHVGVVGRRVRHRSGMAIGLGRLSLHELETFPPMTLLVSSKAGLFYAFLDQNQGFLSIPQLSGELFTSFLLGIS